MKGKGKKREEKIGGRGIQGVSKYKTPNHFSSSDEAIETIAAFSMQARYLVDISNSKDAILAICESSPTCPHRLIFRLVDSSWILGRPDPGHDHAKDTSEYAYTKPSGTLKRKRSTHSPPLSLNESGDSRASAVEPEPELGKFEILPPRLTKRWPTPGLAKDNDSVATWRARSHRRDGPLGLLFIREVYDGKSNIPAGKWTIKSGSKR
jgi:hypothetical protein